VGTGSTFHFTANFGAGEPRAIQHAELRGRHVLVCIENESIRNAVSRILAAHGAEVGVFDGETGADDASEKSGGDVILDLPLDGDAAMIERVLESGVRPEQIVVLIAATRLQAGAQQIARFGISMYLVKPVVEERLIAMIGNSALLSAPSSQREKVDPVRPLRILVAEDNLVNQRVATRFLERDGHQVTVVSDGYAAVCEFQRHAFDVIFMDVQMPVMDGLTATHEIRKLESSLGPHVPIIALTAHSIGGDREHCLEEGMDGYVSEPFKAAELRSAIAPLHLRSCELCMKNHRLRDANPSRRPYGKLRKART
jgi:two-component system sensor histidine kinase/response regulator